MPVFKLEIERFPELVLNDSEFKIQIHFNEELIQEWQPIRSWFPLCNLFQNLNLPLRQVFTFYVCAEEDDDIAIEICNLWNDIINDATDDDSQA